MSFDTTACEELAEALTAISLSAAEVILRMRQAAGIRLKADGSPVTLADEAAETVIRDALSRLDLSLPIVSEEWVDREKPFLESRSFVLVDPIDGTREFIAGRDEYTVNIGVIADGVPILGVITAPALGLIWRGIVGRGAQRLEFSDRKASPPTPIRTRALPAGEPLVMVSRSHLDVRTRAYVDALHATRRISCGSSVKFCRLAEGAADVYPRLAPTRDWDVAAGHAILAAAGGKVVAPDGADLIYGSGELGIPAFVAWGDPTAAVALAHTQPTPANPPVRD